MKLRKLRKNKFASLSYFIVFIYLAFMLVTLFAIGIPITIDMNTAFFGAGQDILADSQERIDTIQDSEVKESINEDLEAAESSTANQIDLLSGFFQYAWIFIILIITFIIFISARYNVEVGGLV